MSYGRSQLPVVIEIVAIMIYNKVYLKSFLPLLLMLVLPAVSRSITLEESLRYALDNSDTFQIAVLSSDRTRAEARGRTAPFKPQVGIEAGFSRINIDDEDFTITLDNIHEVQYGYKYPEQEVRTSLRTSQVLWAGGRMRNTFKLKDSFYSYADLIERSGRRDIKKKVKFAFCRVLFEKAHVDILENRVKQRIEELKDAQDLRNQGMVTSLDVRQAKISLNFAISEQKRGESFYKEAIIDFNVAIGRTGKGAPLIPNGKSDRITESITGLIELVSALLERDKQLELNIAANELLTSQLNKKVVRGEGFPEILFLLSVESKDDNENDPRESWLAGLQLKWNIVDGGVVGAKKATAIAGVRIAKKHLQRVEKELRGIIEGAKVKAKSLDERISLQLETLRLSKENYEDARGHYRAGSITMTQLHESHLAYAESSFYLSSLFFEEHRLLIDVQAMLE